MTAQEGELSEPDLLFPRQEMEGDAHDERAEDPGDEPDYRVHACGAVDDFFALRQTGSHLVDLFLMVRTQRPDGRDSALYFPQQPKYLVDVIFAHKLLALPSLRAM